MAKTPKSSYRAAPKVAEPKLMPDAVKKSMLRPLRIIASAVGVYPSDEELIGKGLEGIVMAIAMREFDRKLMAGVVGGTSAYARDDRLKDAKPRVEDGLHNGLDHYPGSATRHENIHERYRENASKAIRNIATALGFVPKWDPPTLPLDVPDYEKMILEEIARLRKAWIDIAAKPKPAQDGQKSPSPTSFDWYDIRVGKYKMRVQVSRVDGDCVRYPQKSLANAVADVTAIAVRNNQPPQLMARQALSINGVTSVYIQTAKNQHAYEIRKD